MEKLKDLVQQLQDLLNNNELNNKINEIGEIIKKKNENLNKKKDIKDN